MKPGLVPEPGRRWLRAQRSRGGEWHRRRGRRRMHRWSRRCRQRGRWREDVVRIHHRLGRHRGRASLDPGRRHDSGIRCGTLGTCRPQCGDVDPGSFGRGLLDARRSHPDGLPGGPGTDPFERDAPVGPVAGSRRLRTARHRFRCQRWCGRGDRSTIELELVVPHGLLGRRGHHGHTRWREDVDEGEGRLIALRRGRRRWGIVARAPRQRLGGSSAASPPGQLRSGGVGWPRRARGKCVVGPEQPELLEETADGIVGDVDPSQRTEALRLLAEAFEALAAALAADEMRLDLGAPPGVQLVIQVAAQCEQAALHMAISR